MDSLDDLDHFALGMDFLGLYLPTEQQDSCWCRFECVCVDTYTYEEDLVGFAIESSVYNYLFAVSVMHFVTHEIGRGPFVRADVGPARQVAEVWGISIASDWGVGFLLGGGYGIPVTSGTRVLLNANFALRHIEGEQTKSVGITLNGLF